MGSPGLQVLEEIAPQLGDYDVPKHRWSATCGRHLELSLRSRGTDSILLVGGSVHVGIASTAFTARDMDLQVTVVRDCCHELRRAAGVLHGQGLCADVPRGDDG